MLLEKLPQVVQRKGGGDNVQIFATFFLKTVPKPAKYEYKTQFWHFQLPQSLVVQSFVTQHIFIFISGKTVLDTYITVTWQTILREDYFCNQTLYISWERLD